MLFYRAETLGICNTHDLSTLGESEIIPRTFSEFFQFLDVSEPRESPRDSQKLKNDIVDHLKAVLSCWDWQDLGVDFTHHHAISGIPWKNTHLIKNTSPW